MIRHRSVLRILCLGRDPAVCARIRDQIAQGEYQVEWDVARSVSDFSVALSPGLDVIICHEDGLETNAKQALAHLESDGIDVPFIVEGGEYSDKRAAELFGLGVAEYVPAGQRARLLPAVERAIALRVSRQRQESMLQRLSELKSRLDAVVVAAPGVIYRFVRDALGRPRFTYVSDKIRTQFGLEPSVVLKDVWTLFDRIHPDDRPSLFASIDASASSMQRWRWEGRILVGNTYRWTSGNSMPQKMDDGGILWDGILTDITDRKKYEIGLRNAVEHVRNVNHLKTSILTNLSHEIRTPLTGIIGFANLIGDGDLPPDDVESFGRLIVENGERLLSTMDSVLGLAELRGGVRTIELRSTNVARHARSVVESFDYRAQQKGLMLRVESSSGECFAMADENILQRIMTNLVSNAIKFTDEGEIKVSVRLESSDVVITVADTGIGIDNECREEIFEEFVQASSGLNRDYDGIGLGLSITRELVVLLGGILECESEQGVGSTFLVRLPAVGRTAKSLQIDAPSSLADSGVEGRRILIVDRNADNRTLFTRMLSDRWNVTAVQDQSNAIDACRTGRFDAVIVDVELGESVRAVRFRSRIQDLPTGSGMPVVACSAFSEPGDENRFREAGFTDYLAKPFTKTELESVLFGCFDDHLSTTV